MQDTEKEPFHSGSGGLLELVDELCGVTQTLADIIRKQAAVIEQSNIEIMDGGRLEDERKEADERLDRIEMKLRRI